ncbi:MAG: hypothetical protein H7144_07740 [Burkholderiales bacterium]|nr:hypothetical protein [Phycisphaerae bacterium]
MKTTRTILCLVTLALAGGCAEKPGATNGTINTEPLTIDPAMQQRTWEPVTANFQNGDIRTISTGFRYTSDPSWTERNAYYSDSGTFLLNLVTMPYTLYQERDGVTSAGVQLPPTYTAVPPLPGAPEPVSTPMPAPMSDPIPAPAAGEVPSIPSPAN